MPLLLLLSVGCEDNSAAIKDQAGAVVVQEAKVDWDQNSLFHEKEVLARLDSDVVRVAGDEIQSAASLLRSKVYATKAFDLQDKATIAWLNRCQKETYRYIIGQDEMERMFKKSKDAMINYQAIINKATNDLKSAQLEVAKYKAQFQGLNFKQLERKRKLKIANANIQGLKINHQAALLVARSSDEDEQKQAYQLASKIGSQVASSLKELTFLEIKITDAGPALREAEQHQEAAQSSIDFNTRKIKNTKGYWAAAIKNRNSFNQSAEVKYTKLKKHFDTIGDMFWSDVAGAFNRSFSATDIMIKQVENRLDHVKDSELDDARIVVLIGLEDKMDIQFELLSILKGYIFYLDHAVKYSGKTVDRKFVQKVQKEIPRAKNLFAMVKKSTGRTITKMHAVTKVINFENVTNKDEIVRQLASFNVSIERTAQFVPDSIAKSLKIEGVDSVELVFATKNNTNEVLDSTGNLRGIPAMLLPKNTIGYLKIDLAKIDIDAVKKMGIPVTMLAKFEIARDLGLKTAYNIIIENAMSADQNYMVLEISDDTNCIDFIDAIIADFPEVASQADITHHGKWVLLKGKNYDQVGQINTQRIEQLKEAARGLDDASIQLVAYLSPQLRVQMPMMALMLGSQTGINADPMQISNVINKLQHLAINISLEDKLEIDLGVGFLDGQAATFAQKGLNTQLENLDQMFEGLTKYMAIKTSGNRLEVAISGDNLVGELQSIAMNMMLKGMQGGPNSLPQAPGNYEGRLTPQGSQNAKPVH